MIADYPMAGPSDISRDDFSRILAENASPSAVESDGMYDACLAEGVSPVTFLAFFNHESDYGKLGICFDYDTKNPGNVRSPEDPTLGVVIDTRGGAFAKYPTWENGALDWGKRIVGPKYAGEGLMTVRDVLPKYAPTGDNNDPEAYIDSVLRYVDTYGIPEVVAQQAATLTGAYDIAYDIVEASVTSGGNYWPTRQGHQARVVVCHITDGPSASSAIGWFRNPESDVSAHYVVDRDAEATIYRCLDEACASWAQGVVESPDLSVPIVAGWVRDGVNPNLESVSIETAGYWQDGYTAAQIDAVGWLVGDICRRQGIPIDRDHVLGHYQISSQQRANCPSLTEAEWATILTIAGAETPAEPTGPYATPDAAYDAYCAQWDDDVVWAGEIRDKGHWYQRNPQEVSRTVGNRLLAYDGAYAQNASGWMMDEWENASWSSGQLTIWGKEPPPAGTPPPTAPVDPVVGVVGAAWPVNPGDGATDVATDVTLAWGSDAPTSDVEFDQSDGVRIFALQAHSSTAYGPLELAEATTYVWRVRGRDSGNVSDWTEARFGTAHPAPETPDKPDTPDKPPSTEPYPDVVSPTAVAQPAATTWRNTSDNKVDLAVSRQWRSDSDGGTGPWPDTDAWLNPDFPGAETAQSPLELRKLTRRLSMHPPIVEAAWRAGLWASVPATYQVDGSQWEDDASQDYNDTWSSMPAHAQTWASQICTLGTAIQKHPDLAAAFVSLGIWSAYATTWTERYHALRVRVRDLAELAHC